MGLERSENFLKLRNIYHNPCGILRVKLNDGELYVENALGYPSVVILDNSKACVINKIQTHYSLSKGLYVLPTGIYDNLDSLKYKYTELKEIPNIEELTERIFRKNDKEHKRFMKTDFCHIFTNIVNGNNNTSQRSKRRFMEQFDNLTKQTNKNEKRNKFDILNSDINLDTSSCPNQEDLEKLLRTSIEKSKANSLENNACGKTSDMNKETDLPSTSFDSETKPAGDDTFSEEETVSDNEDNNTNTNGLGQNDAWLYLRAYEE